MFITKLNIILMHYASKMVRSKIGRWECIKCKPAHSCKLCKLQSGTHDLDPKTTERGGAILQNTPCGLTHSSRFIHHRGSTAASEIPTCPTPLPPRVPARRSWSPRLPPVESFARLGTQAPPWPLRRACRRRGGGLTGASPVQAWELQ
jgi:hypothetical protein